MRFILFFFSILLALPSFGDIQKTQVYLNDLGYPAGSVDGLWGKKTEQALLDFLQADVDLLQIRVHLFDTGTRLH